MFKHICTLLIMLPSLCLAQDNYRYSEVVKPAPYTMSTNVAFVVDASSTINYSADIGAKFDKAWNETVARIASDELYFCVYTFHDKGLEKYRPWAEAGGPQGKQEFDKARVWIKQNTGTYSWGQAAIGKALREVNPIGHNRVMNRTLTIILITDGGFTEAARYSSENKDFDYEKDDSFQPIINEIKKGQEWRVANGLFPAIIRTIGLENKEYWSEAVKRPDEECQLFLEKTGKLYKGGYYLVKRRRRVS